ncbi:MAG: hypothetical protein MUO24_07960 [Desulfobacterales bacterium]|nr:hypothetical protein [Desulfobacterales bacterium]
MKTELYYLGLAVVIGILCVPVLGEVELPQPEDEPLLLAQPNPTLTGIRQLYIVILPPDAEPNKDGLVWKNLEAAVESKISQSGIKIAQAIRREHILRSLAIPELRIDINMLKIVESQQYIFHIQTSLAKKVYLTKDASQRIKVDLWKTEPTMRAVSAEGMPAAVTSAVLEQVEAFIHAHLAANPPNKRPSDSNDISIAPEEQVEPAAESTPAEYKYVASKNSKVFHKPECSSAKRIKPENLVGYSTREKAINAGKKPCKLCKP